MNLSFEAPQWVYAYEHKVTEWSCEVSGKPLFILDAKIPVDSDWDRPGEGEAAWLMAIDPENHPQNCPHCGQRVLKCLMPAEKHRGA